MKWSRLTIILFSLSLAFMVIGGFLLLMMLGGPPGSIDQAIGRHGLPVAVFACLACGLGAWINHGRGRRNGVADGNSAGDD
jgi:purine-cytosine permease-like protein